MLTVTLGLLATPKAQAAGEGCTERDLSKAAVGRTREAKVASMERKLKECEGRLTNEELARALRFLLDEYQSPPPDFDGCLRVTSRLIQLGKVRNYVQYNDDYGYCGGDCAKSPRPGDCQDGRSRREKDLAFEKYLDSEAKVGADFQMEQPIPCAPDAARKVVANLDKAAFYGLALRFLAKYEKECRQAADPSVRASLANDKAIIFFHKGDDAGCLRTLDELAPSAKSSQATAFNRTLCGGPCTLAANRCTKVQETRERALHARAKLDPSGTAPNEPICSRGNFTRRGTHVFTWDLKSYRVCERGKCERKEHPMSALGDLDGDGWGEYASRSIEAHELRGDLGTVRQPYVVFRLFSNVDLCERGEFSEVATLGTEDLVQEEHPLDYTAKVTAPPDAASKSYCIYPSKGLKCSATACNKQPYSCADLTEASE